MSVLFPLLELCLMISDFYKNDIINEFINTEESSKLGAREDALIGLNYLGLLSEQEKAILIELLKKD